jgi:chitobiase/beta-hexosaminidase-like protein/Big-like domain-containing protein
VSFAATEALSGLAPETVTAPLTLSADGLNLSATGRATDVAGNVGSVSRVGINIDRQPPTITVVLTPGPDASGFYTGPVTAHFTCADSGSGIANCPPDQIVATPGANLTVAGTGTDRAANTAAVTSRSFTIRIPTPTITITLTPGPNGNGWHNTAVTAHFTCAENGAPLSGCPADRVVATDGANQTVTGTVTDPAGTMASATSDPFNIDLHGPTVTVSLSPAPNANGWHTTTVTSHFTCTDTLSGIASCPPDQVVASEGPDQHVSGSAVDMADNTETVLSSVFNMDLTAPSIGILLSPPPNANGWNNGTVTAHFTCGDTGSGIAACPPDEAIAVEGANQTMSRTVADNAGNSAAVTSVLVNLDRTTPSITVALSPSLANGMSTGPVTAHFTCADSLSGVASCSPDEVVTIVGANQTVSGSATDRAGNTVSVTSEPFTVTNASAVTVALTTPFPGTVFVTPASLPLEASATITGGTLTRVDFFDGSTLIGSALTSPYRATWSSPPIGEHTLTAVATDQTGAVAGSPAIAIRVASTGGGLGTLGAPIATPPAGAYRPGQLVTLLAASGTTIRYTTTGSSPTSSSPTYVAPIALARSTTLKAQAVLAGWVSSPVTTLVYDIDTMPPTITASVSPGPDAAGWNNTAVTVIFACADASGVASCPDPVVVENEGAGLLVSGTATDTGGNEATASVNVKIDKTAPAISFLSPNDQTQTPAATISLQATASDTLSGLESASCNGTPAVVSTGAITCTVPLLAGANSVIVRTTDFARNSASAGVRIFRTGPITSLNIASTSRSLLVGEELPLKVIDQVGTIVAEAVWVSDDPLVAMVTVVEDGTSRLTAKGVGRATLTAAFGGLSADLAVTVFAGNSIPVGTAKWQTSGSGFYERAFPAHQLTPEGPELFVDVWDETRGLLIHALSADGDLLWSEPVKGFDPLFADMFGGAVHTLRENGAIVGLTRTGGQTGGLPWEYRASGWMDGQFQSDIATADERQSTVAQGPDGTIYHLEYDASPTSSPGGWTDYDFYRGTRLVAIDGRTGLVKRRTTLPKNDACTWGWGMVVGDMNGLRPMKVYIAADGAAYVGMSTFNMGCPKLIHEYHVMERIVRTYLVRVDGTGASSNIVVRERADVSNSDPVSQRWSGTENFSRVVGLTADGRGGVTLHGVDLVANYDGSSGETQSGESGWGIQYRDGAIYAVSGFEHGDLPFQAATPQHISLVSSDGTSYIHEDNGFDNRSLSARASDGSLKWTAWVAEGEAPIQALPDGEVLLNNRFTGTLTRINERGIRSEADVLPGMSSGVRTAVDEFSGPFFDSEGNYGGFGKVQTSGFDDRTVAPNRYGQNAAMPEAKTGIFAKGHEVLLGAYHVAIRIVPKNQTHWRRVGGIDVNGKFTRWTDIFKYKLNFVYFATLGAGSSLNKGCDGFLESAPNRDRDVNVSPSHLEALLVPSHLEDTKIGLLFDRDSNFNDADLPYACYPDVPIPDKTYNSNSYTHGLLNASGIMAPMFATNALFPGWGKPVPSHKFD